MRFRNITRGFGLNRLGCPRKPPVGWFILWMDEILHHFETTVETTVCWYLRWGIVRNQGFLGGARWISSIHRGPSQRSRADLEHSARQSPRPGARVLERLQPGPAGAKWVVVTPEISSNSISGDPNLGRKSKNQGKRRWLVEKNDGCKEWGIDP